MGWDWEKEKKAGKAMTLSGCIFGLAFSVFWCVMAASMGAWFMLIFGVPFVGMMAYRLYVMVQLSKEEPKQQKQESDPWAQPREPRSGNGYCPYCGGAVEENFAYCPRCGRKQ